MSQEAESIQVDIIHYVLLAYAQVRMKFVDISKFPKASHNALNRIRNLFELFLPSIRDDSPLVKKKKSNIYSYSELLYQMLRLYWDSGCKESLEMERLNYQLFNEEIGEVSLSILSRYDYTDGTKFCHRVQDFNNKLIPLVRKLYKVILVS